jgi:alcohol dehydrogenase class IV
LTGKPQAQPADGATWVAALATEMGIAPLAECGLTQALIPELVSKAQASSSMQGNSLPLLDNELAAILHRAL